MLAVALQGIFLLAGKTQYRGFIVVLLLMVFSSVFNLLEETNISREIWLVTPIFVLGFGPAFYLAVKSAITTRLPLQDVLHFVPMLALLPLTQQQPQLVIAIGTLWRLGYALLTLRLILQYNQLLRQQRSDAEECSFVWFGWVIGVHTMVSMLDLLRLNVQPELGQAWNQLGQGISTAISLLLLAFIIIKLVKIPQAFAKVALLWPELTAVAAEPENTGARLSTCSASPAESAADYASIFTELDRQIQQQQWYTQPRLSLEQLSQLTGLNQRDISRAINLVAGLNFNDYINQLRVSQVKAQMAQAPDMPVLTLAMNAGFNSKSTFNTTFKQWVGLTPSSYRKQLLTGQS